MGPPKRRPNCRNCDQLPTVPGALYCELCLADVVSLTRMALRQRHPAECFCVDCMCEAQRNFRRVQAAAKRANRMRLVLDRPDPPEPTPPPSGPRAA